MRDIKHNLSQALERRIQNQTVDFFRVLGCVHYRQGSTHASAPQCYFLDTVVLGNELYHFPNVFYLFLAVSDKLALAFATAREVKGNEIDVFESDLQAFKFVSSVAVEI